MNLTDRALRALERVDHIAGRSPVVIMMRKRCLDRERNAFELGVQVAQLRVGGPGPQSKRERHLHVV